MKRSPVRIESLLIASMFIIRSLAIVATAQDPPDVVKAAIENIRPAAIRAHVRFLSDDLLEGRRPGTRGYQLAAKYVSAQFEAMGLQPAGEDGGFFQPVPLRTARIMEPRCALVLKSDRSSRPLVFAKDYLLRANCQSAEVSVTAPVVFVGYGVTAPERNYDDYATFDVTGKFVVMLSGAPEGFPNNQRAFYSSRAEKLRIAAAHGAVGVLEVRTPEDLQRYSWDRLVADGRQGDMCWLDKQNVPHNVLYGSESKIQVVAIMSPTGAKELFQGTGHSLETVLSAAKADKSQSFDLKIAATIRSATTHEDFDSPNVVGVIARIGSDFA